MEEVILTQDIWKKKLLATTLFAGVAGGIWAGAAIAQETSSTPAAEASDEEEEAPIVIEEVADEDEARQERVVVTGSRLARDEYSSVSPLQVIDGDTARDLGLVDASDLLGQTTVVQGQQTTTGLSTSAGLLSDNGPGSATASLRGLDAGRTLVLINGRRLAPAGVRGAPSAPDLNLIPGSLIERVDVLLDGASSVYGSDAVAGVVNYILRTDFDGLQLDAFYTDPEMRGNGGKQQVYTASLGISNDRGYMAFAAEHSRTDGFSRGDFGSFYYPYTLPCQRFYAQGQSGDLYESCTGSFGAGAVSGTPFGFLYYDEGFDYGAPLPPNFRPIPVTADLLTPGSVNGSRLLLFPEELNATLTPDFSRTTFYTTGEYETDLYGDLTVYFEGSHAYRDTYTNTSGQGRVRIPADYALNELGATGTLYYNSRFVNETNVAQSRLIGGMKGELPFMNAGPLDNWGYDAYLSYSRSSGNDVVSGIPFYPRLEQTLSNTRFDSALGEFVCDPRGVTGETQTVSCRPLDFYDSTFINTGRFSDPADNEYLFPNRITDTTVEQTVFNAYLSGDLFELPAGPLGMVIGVELRDDAIETRTDAGATAGDFFGFFADPGSNGQRNLQEAFIELEAPLLADMPLVHELTLNGAARWTEEDNFGSQWTYRIQGVYAPTDWVSVRSTYGTSFRAPNLGEQFGGRVVGFGDPSDPCRVPGVAVPFGDYDNDPNTPDTREYQPNLDPRDPEVISNCQNGGGPFGLEPTDPTQLGIGGLGSTNPVFFGAPTQVASGSNPNLAAETSKALSAGIVFEQPFTDAFDLRASVTYFDITVEDEVDQLTANTIVNRCYNSPNLSDPQCAFVTRAPRVAGDDTSGEITFVNALNQNLGDQTVEGIDYNIEFNYEFNVPGLEGPVGYDLIARATQSLTQTEEQFLVDGIFVDDDLGEYGNPEWRLNFTNILNWNDYRLLFQSRYIGEMIEDNDDPFDQVTSGFNPCVQAGDQFPAGSPQAPNGAACISYDNAEEYWVHDMSVAWQGDTLIVRGGISNVFDEAPPLTNNNDLGTLGGIGYDLGGRTLFLNVTKTF
ncbi:TonB-dependent receptor [Henriciella mobilis]|uniref:TonB-dependent receptor n=1 Tax=Henriciella mobilis TaxID=2305467 RepID=A0A399RCZ8_9PROT|nr:TonB-dependent receptor [Henriciella mobilis]RIJ19782.1 TonB-dependent receptor [Henriciella mobilis]RIJ28454.1 TonB-dependent receptor [Henriciella mobilis]